ncbi:MAG: Na+/H+ antiporter subunit E [Actinomycetota bacterium]|nr:Na+/H+ antiporter subunit E [Actinomycetota bacterium]
MSGESPGRLAGGGRRVEVVVALALLVLVYALALGSFQALDLLAGALVSMGALAAFRRFLFPPRGPVEAGAALGRVLWFWPFLLVVARDVLVGSWRVALAVVGLRPPVASGIVAVPMEGRSELGVAVTGLAISLTPGELVVDLDWERRVLLVHALDADDPDAVRAHQRRLYDRYQRRVFP